MKAGLGPTSAQLAALVRRGIEFPPGLAAPRSARRSAREAAILILFGEASSVPLVGLPGPGSGGSRGPGRGLPPDGSDLLLLRRTDNLSHHPGQIAFPGGGKDPSDADATAAALREAQEETRLDPANVAVAGELGRVFLPNSNNLVTPVLGTWESRPTLVPDGLETAEVFRVPTLELLDPENRRTVVVPAQESRETRPRYQGPGFQLGPQFGGSLVWGFTAMVMDSLFAELGWEREWDKERTVGLQL